jgi:hypothetical protein
MPTPAFRCVARGLSGSRFFFWTVNCEDL